MQAAEVENINRLEAFPNFPAWLIEVVARLGDDPIIETNVEMQYLLITPSLIARSYKSMATFGNHFWVVAWLATSNMVTYDFGVMGEFEHRHPITHDN